MCSFKNINFWYRNILIRRVSNSVFSFSLFTFKIVIFIFRLVSAKKIHLHFLHVHKRNFFLMWTFLFPRHFTPPPVFVRYFISICWAALELHSSVMKINLQVKSEKKKIYWGKWENSRSSEATKTLLTHFVIHLSNFKQQKQSISHKF